MQGKNRSRKGSSGDDVLDNLIREVKSRKNKPFFKAEKKKERVMVFLQSLEPKEREKYNTSLELITPRTPVVD